MTNPAWAEMRLAVGGALRLAIGDRRGLGCFDASIEGFWRSFRAALICYPLYLLLLALRIAAPRWAQHGAAPILIVETIAYVISWTAFPLLILPLTRWFDREQRFFTFMVAYNWAQIPQTALFLVVALDGATGVLPPAGVQFAELLATVAVLVYEWYLARVALAISGTSALLVVIFDLVLGTTLGRVAESLY